MYGAPGLVGLCAGKASVYFYVLTLKSPPWLHIQGMSSSQKLISLFIFLL